MDNSGLIAESSSCGQGRVVADLRAQERIEFEIFPAYDAANITIQGTLSVQRLE